MKCDWMVGTARRWTALGMAVALYAPHAVFALDAEAAESLARRENCLKCHGVDKKKEGPSYKSVAAKHKGEPDAEEKLIEHVKSGKSVQMASGDWEDHKIIKTKDQEAIRNLVQWILSLE